MLRSVGTCVVQDEAHGCTEQGGGVTLSTPIGERAEVDNPCSVGRFAEGDDARDGNTAREVEGEGVSVRERLMGRKQRRWQTWDYAWMYCVYGADGLKALCSVGGRAVE